MAKKNVETRFVILLHLEAAGVLVYPADDGGVVAGAVQQVADEDVQRRQRQLRRVFAGPPSPSPAGRSLTLTGRA